MKRSWILIAAFLVAAACSGKNKKGTTTASGSGSDGPALLVKKVSLSWGVQPDGEMADIFLVTTDETGKQVSNPVGRYKGKCAPMKPAPEMGALTGVACVTGGGGTELHAIARPDEIIVMQLGTEPGKKPDPMAREQVSSVKVPLGIAIEAAP